MKERERKERKGKREGELRERKRWRERERAVLNFGLLWMRGNHAREERWSLRK